jgi:DNA-binding Xre family transcriptional regulator
LTTVFRLREVMEARRPGLTLMELARESGVSRPTCQALYHNKTTRVDLGTLDKIAAFLGAPVGELLGPAAGRARR